jgi:F-type H+-transporting ATPase subunit b
MNTLLLLADAGGSGQIEQIARTFGVDWSHLIAQIISFCIVCALLYRFAYAPVLAMLDKRRQGIAEAQANAEKIKAELAQTESHRQELIMQANEQATQLIEEARTAAVRVGDQETQQAIAAAEQILVKARETAAQEHQRMLAELKREIGRLVVETTAAVSGKVLTPDDQQRLAEETANKLAA